MSRENYFGRTDQQQMQQAPAAAGGGRDRGVKILKALEARNIFDTVPIELKEQIENEEVRLLDASESSSARFGAAAMPSSLFIETPAASSSVGVEEEKHETEPTTFVQKLDDARGAASSARFR